LLPFDRASAWEAAAFLLLGLFGVEVTTSDLVSTLVAAIVGGMLIDAFDLDHLAKKMNITTNNRSLNERCQRPTLDVFTTDSSGNSSPSTS
jgi:uncharacterized membrane protein YraQ (UPF0718 family)